MVNAMTDTFNAEPELAALASGPAFLRDLLSQIPADLLKKPRKPGKWTIHEHAVHLTVIDDVMIGRLGLFRARPRPSIVPYQPGEGVAAVDLFAMDLTQRLEIFEQSRPRLVDAFRALAPADWQKQADHPEYIIYTPRIMLRHLVMHEHLHGYRIEELWLTKDELLLG